MTHSTFTLASLATLALLGSSVLAQPAMSHDTPEHKTSDRTEPRVYVPASEKNFGDPYTLDTCPISGMKLGAMGDAIVKVYKGREVRFCCAKCPEKFEADMGANFKKLDAMFVKSQLPYYPLTTCVVSGEGLAMHGDDASLDMIFGNRLVRLCCEECIAEFKADPAVYIDKLDAAVIAAQSDRYPLLTCVVSDEELGGGGMGKPIDVVVANRVVRLCCKMCKKDLMKDPASFIKKLDAAWVASDGGMPGVDAMPMNSSMDDDHKDMKSN